MKKILILLIFVFLSFSHTGAEDLAYELASEVSSASGIQIVIPDDISWTQRFILTELKDLRVDLEVHQREVNNIINTKELTTVDRALSYSANTVNFFFVVLTILVMGFGIFGWKTMKDVKINLAKNFEKEVQKGIRLEQKKLEVFMQKFEQEQLEQSKVILQNQEFIKNKQEAGYIWSQYNREENLSGRLELLEKITSVGLEEDEILIYTERSGIYVELALWDKVLESTEKGLEISLDNITLLYNKASALVMLEQTEEAVKVLTNIIGVNPGMKEDILEAPMFENIQSQLEEYISNQEV